MPFIFNVAKGVHAHYATLPATNDALVAVLLEATGVESDAVLKDYDTLAAVLAGASNEQTTMGRQTLTGVTSTVNDTTDKRIVDFDNPSWASAAGSATAKVVFCYDPDTTGGTDADLIPLYCDDFAVTPAGGTVTYQVDAAGIAESA